MKLRKALPVSLLAAALLLTACSLKPAEVPKREAPGVPSSPPPAAQPASPAALPPVIDLVNDPNALLQMKDESGKDPALAEFMRRLKLVVAAKDDTALLAMTADKVRVSFGEDNGKQAFIKQWKLDESPQQSAVWAELSDILALGGSFGDPAPGEKESRLYFAPYIFQHFPAGYDNFQYLAVLGKDVKVRQAPSADAPVVANLSYTVVRGMGEAPSDRTEVVDGRPYRWVSVETLDGQRGYVLEKFVRSPVDYRLGVSKGDDGAWSIVFLVAGD